jgi:hypothetical protein
MLNTARVAPVLACAGCGGLVPDITGPVHPYMPASPGCWHVYGEVSEHWHGRPDSDPARWHHVDAYAVQHPGGAEHDRRQRQSVAVHLIALCSLLELGQLPHRAPASRGRTSQVILRMLELRDWPFLTPPHDLGAVTVVDVHAATTLAEREASASAWLEAAWGAWEEHHPVIRAWAAVMQVARP